MLIWVLLFIIVLTISIILAFKSMADYRESPLNFKIGYTLYLISKPNMLTPDLLNGIYKATFPEKPVLSIERLFKGQKRALLIFGPISILRQFKSELGLIELEEYSQGIETEIAWEVGTKHPLVPIAITNLLLYIPRLNSEEEFWWQVVLQPYADSFLSRFKHGTNKKRILFKAIIRAVVKANDRKRAQSLQTELSKIGSDGGLLPLPQSYPISQIIKFYQERVLPLDYTTNLSSEEILQLLF